MDLWILWCFINNNKEILSWWEWATVVNVDCVSHLLWWICHSERLLGRGWADDLATKAFAYISLCLNIDNRPPDSLSEMLFNLRDALVPLMCYLKNAWAQCVWNYFTTVPQFILLHEKFLRFNWFRAVVFQLNLKYLHVKLQTLAWFEPDIWHKYHSWYFKIVWNFTRLTAREITYNNFEHHSWYLCQISLLIMLLPILMPRFWQSSSFRSTKGASAADQFPVSRHSLMLF